VVVLAWPAVGVAPLVYATYTRRARSIHAAPQNICDGPSRPPASFSIAVCVRRLTRSTSSPIH